MCQINKLQFLSPQSPKTVFEIPKETPKGKLGFHASRVAFSTLLDKHGATTKEMQSLVRHTDPRITIGTYTEARDERLHELIENVNLELSSTNAPASPNDISNEKENLSDE